MQSNNKLFYTFSAVVLVLFYGVFVAVALTKCDEWRVSKSKEYLYEAKKLGNESEKMLALEMAAFLNPNEETYLLAGVQAIKLGDSALAGRYLGRVRTAEGYFQLGNAYYNLSKYDLAVISFTKALNIRETNEVNEALGKSYLKIGDLENAKQYLSKASTQDSTIILVLLGVGNNDSNVSRETNPANRAVLVYNEFNRLGYPQSAISVLNQAETSGYLTRDSLIVLANRENSHENYQQAYNLLQRAKSIDPYYPQIYQQLVVICEKLGKGDEVKRYQDFLSQITF